MTIGEKIQLLRELRGYSRVELGIALGYSKSTAEKQVALYETGERQAKSSTIEKFANALEISYSVFESQDPLERAIQEVFWLNQDERLEVEIALEELNKMEDSLTSGDIRASELSLWKFQYNANKTVREELEWN